MKTKIDKAIYRSMEGGEELKPRLLLFSLSVAVADILAAATQIQRHHPSSTHRPYREHSLTPPW